MTLFAKIGALLTTLLSSSAVRAVAFKYFIKAVILVAIPLAVFMSVNLVFGTIIEWVVEKIAELDTSSIPISYQISGLAGWFFVELGLDTALSIILSAAGIRMALRSIPFLNL